MWNDARLLNATANALFVTAAVLLLLASLSWIIHRPMFDLKTVRIEGVSREEGKEGVNRIKGHASAGLQRVSKAALRAGTLPRLRGNFFTADLDEVRSAFEGVAWVRRAAVRREWPNGLVVSIEEHQPLGTWGENRLVNTFGEVFTANVAEAESEGELLAFAGPPDTEKEVVRRYHDFLKWFAPIQAKPVRVVLTQRYAWQVKTDTGTVLEFGREQDPTTLPVRAERFVRAWPQIARLTQRVDFVDLRYANGFALRAPGLKIDDSTSNISRRT